MGVYVTLPLVLSEPLGEGAKKGGGRRKVRGEKRGKKGGGNGLASDAPVAEMVLAIGFDDRQGVISRPPDMGEGCTIVAEGTCGCKGSLLMALPFGTSLARLAVA